MDLAVVGVGAAAHHDGVVRRGVAALEQPRDDGGAALGGDPLDLGHERPVERLGDRTEVGAGLAEVAGPGLGEAPPGRRPSGTSRVEPVPVLHRVERRRLLHQHDLHGPSLPPGGRPGSPATARLVGWSGRRWSCPAAGAARLDGADKSALEYAGRTLLEHALDGGRGGERGRGGGPTVPTSQRRHLRPRVAAGRRAARRAVPRASPPWSAGRPWSWCWPSTCPTSPPTPSRGCWPRWATGDGAWLVDECGPPPARRGRTTWARAHPRRRPRRTDATADEARADRRRGLGGPRGRRRRHVGGPRPAPRSADIGPHATRGSDLNTCPGFARFAL